MPQDSSPPPDDPPPEELDLGFEPEPSYELAEDPDGLPPRPVPVPLEEPRRRRRLDAEEPNDRPPPVGDRLLDRKEVPPAVPWWVAPSAVFAFGLLLCVLTIGVLAIQAGAAAGATMVAMAALALVVQLAAVTALLMFVGQFFGIDYGPAHEAIVKLAAVVAVVDGLTAILSLGCTPCGLVVAALVGAGVFQYLFRLAVHEMLLSVAGMVAAAWILNAAVIAVILHKYQKQNSQSTAVATRFDGAGRLSKNGWDFPVAFEALKD